MPTTASTAVISAGLDAMGGLAVMAAIGARHMDEAPDVRLHRFAKLGTIDLRVDYLRPGIGEYFDLHATVMRLGSRVASTRMEFRGGGWEVDVDGGRGLHHVLIARMRGAGIAPIFYVPHRREAVAGLQGIGLTVSLMTLNLTHAWSP